MSTRTKLLPPHWTGTSIRSLVTPGDSWAIASRRPASRLTSVDFPTFWRPITATTGGRPASDTWVPKTAWTSTSACERTSLGPSRVVSRTWASAAGSRGLVLASIESRRTTDSPTSGPPPRSRSRRLTRTAGSADRKIFTSASGNTTVPMSRPSITHPPDPRARCAPRRTDRTWGCRATSDTMASTSPDVRVGAGSSASMRSSEGGDGRSENLRSPAIAASPPASSAATPRARAFAATARYIRPVLT